MRFDVIDMLTVSAGRIRRARRRVYVAGGAAALAGGLVGLPWGVPAGGVVAALVLGFDWNTWRKYVLHGNPERPEQPAEYDEPGELRVVLQSSGLHWRQVANTICDVRDVPWSVAKAMTHSLPSAVAIHVSPRSADLIRKRLERVGAVAVVESDQGSPV